MMLGLIVAYWLVEAIKVALGREEDGLVRLTVADDGVGYPEEADSGSSSTLGNQFVGLLARQLRGKMRVEHHAGTPVTLTIPPVPEKHRS